MSETAELLGSMSTTESSGATQWRLRSISAKPCSATAPETDSRKTTEKVASSAIGVALPPGACAERPHRLLTPVRAGCVTQERPDNLWLVARIWVYADSPTNP